MSELLELDPDGGPKPLALCSLDDIAHQLGFDDSTSLTDSQLARIPLILAKLSQEFRWQAGREFTPGTSTVQLLSLSGRIRLPDYLGPQGTVDEVVTYSGTVLDPSTYTVRNNAIIVNIPMILGSQRPGTGDRFEVTYTHTGQCDMAVRSVISAACARYLTVDPNSAVAQSTFLSAEGYHQRIAAWVADVVKLMPEDIALAKSYRPFPSSPIIQKIHSPASPNMDWSQSWVWGGITLW